MTEENALYRTLNTVNKTPPGEIIAIDDRTEAARLIAAGAIEHVSDVPADDERPAAVAVSDDARAELIDEAVAGLDPDNPDHFTAGGVPQVKAVEAALGFDITGEERHESWARVQAARELE